MKYNSPHCTLYSSLYFNFWKSSNYLTWRVTTGDERIVCSALYLYDHQGGRLWKHWPNITDCPNTPHQLIVNIPQCVEYVSLTWIPSRSVQFFLLNMGFCELFQTHNNCQLIQQNVCHRLRLISSVPGVCLPSTNYGVTSLGSPG